MLRCHELLTANFETLTEQRSAVFEDAYRALWPPSDLLDTLRVIAHARMDELDDLTRRQEDEPRKPLVEWVGGTSERRGYPLCAIPMPDRPGALWASRMPGYPRSETLTADLEGAYAHGIRHLICLVPQLDAERLEVPAYPQAAKARFGEGHRFVEVLDMEVPPVEADIDAALVHVDVALQNGEQVLVHCAAGCGRTGLFVSALLVRCGLDPASAIRHYRLHRSCGPETILQVAWVFRYAERLNAGLTL